MTIRIDKIKTRLEEIGERATGWTIVEVRGEGNFVHQLDIMEGNTKVASVFNRDDAEFIVNAPRDVDHLLAQVEGIQKIIDANQERIKTIYAYGNQLDVLNSLMQNYSNTAADAVAWCCRFRDMTVTYLRAIVMCAEMAGNGATHTEKAARQRGLVEMIESAIEKMLNMNLTLQFHSWRIDDIFKSDYPTREFMHRIHRLEEENLQLKKEITAFTAQPKELEEEKAEKVKAAWGKSYERPEFHVDPNEYEDQ